MLDNILKIKVFLKLTRNLPSHTVGRGRGGGKKLKTFFTPTLPSPIVEKEGIKIILNKF